MTNTQIAMLFVILVVMALASALGSYSFTLQSSASLAYVYPQAPTGQELLSGLGYAFLTFVILYNNLIPISLIVTMEVVKYVQAKLIESDAEMYY